MLKGNFAYYRAYDLDKKYTILRSYYLTQIPNIPEKCGGTPPLLRKLTDKNDYFGWMDTC